MKRILVIGCSGTGKTILARWLARQLRLPLVVLDQDHWGPGWTEPTDEAWRKTVRTLSDRDAWVMDGTYHATLAERLPAADAVIWLDFSRWRCLIRVLARGAIHWGRVRGDVADGCPERLDREFLDYVWRFNEVTRPRIGAAIQAHRHPVVVVLRSPGEVAKFRAEFRLPA